MTETLHIQTLTPEGLGLGDGEKPLRVPFVLEGEEVTISKPFKKAGKKFAEALEIVKPSPERVAPFCPHFGTCGGCLTQHFEYQGELRWKEERMRDLFSPFQNFEAHPILAAQAMNGWRNKMEFTFSRYGELGLYQFFGKHRVFDIEHCSLGPPWFQEAANLFREFQKELGLPSFNMRTGEGSLRTLTLRHGFRSSDRMILLTVSGDTRYAWKKAHLTAFKAIGEKLGASLFLIIQQAIKGHPTQFYEMHLHGKDTIEERLRIDGKELSFQISPRAFFQPNPIQAEKLYQRAFELLNLRGDEVLLDLFAGTGTIGLFGAHLVKKVISIELSKEACLDAKANKERNSIENIEILEGDVGEVLKNGLSDQPDALIIDPPRSGLTPKAIDAICQLKPQKIAYISCNPNTQVQNLFPLLEQGFVLKAIQPVDQFPRSPHVENIALLERL